MIAEHTIAMTSASDVVTARQAGREVACALGFGSMNQTRLATAISELVDAGA